jgi:hypothetical protein
MRVPTHRNEIKGLQFKIEQRKVMRGDTHHRVLNSYIIHYVTASFTFVFSFALVHVFALVRVRSEAAPMRVTTHQNKVIE